MVYDPNPSTLAQVLCGDAAKVLCDLPDGIADTAMCSPPYFNLRDYKAEGQVGLERSPEAYVARLVEILEGLKRVLRPDGTLWVNIGDSFATSGGAGWQGKNGQRVERRHTQVNLARQLKLGKPEYGPGVKPKDLLLVPYLFAAAMRSAGWFLRSEIIWHKTNAMPSSQKDRPTVDFEKVFLFALRRKYYYDYKAVWVDPTEEKMKKGSKGHNLRTTWSIPTRGFRGAHFATFPPNLAYNAVKAGCRPGGVVIDPFCGAASTGIAALMHGRRFLGIELNPDNVKLSQDRLTKFLAPPEPRRRRKKAIAA